MHFELILLRILKYETDITTVFSNNSALLETVLAAGLTKNIYGTTQLSGIVQGTLRHGAAADVALAKEDKEYASEFGIVPLLDSQVGWRACRAVVDCYRDEGIALEFCERHVAVAAVYIAICEEGYKITRQAEEWVKMTLDEVGVDDVESEDLKITLQLIDKLQKIR